MAIYTQLSYTGETRNLPGSLDQRLVLLTFKDLEVHDDDLKQKAHIVAPVLQNHNWAMHVYHHCTLCVGELGYKFTQMFSSSRGIL